MRRWAVIACAAIVALAGCSTGDDAVAQGLEHVLRACGDNLTRQNIMKQAANLDIALPMFLLLLTGDDRGLLLGAIMFQVASIIDGVDGEMARATWRTCSRARCSWRLAATRSSRSDTIRSTADWTSWALVESASARRTLPSM